MQEMLPVPPRVAPLETDTDGLENVLVSRSVPADMFVLLPQLFDPDKVSVPAPDFVSALPPPDITPA
jgi:hypothetical protein